MVTQHANSRYCVFCVIGIADVGLPALCQMALTVLPSWRASTRTCVAFLATPSRAVAIAFLKRPPALATTVRNFWTLTSSFLEAICKTKRRSEGGVPGRQR